MKILLMRHASATRQARVGRKNTVSSQPELCRYERHTIINTNKSDPPSDVFVKFGGRLNADCDVVNVTYPKYD